jgi:multimeric flavodoxin WrbA
MEWMKVIVLNGSPKGDVSVTMQYVAYIQKKFPAHDYTIFNVAQDIRKIEKDGVVFGRILDTVRSADLVLWAFPLYYLLVSSQYKRFIELIFERNAQQAFAGKYTASLSTSIHFFDQTAHNYVHAICDDLGMHYCGFYSAEMKDLLKEEERNRFTRFAQLLIVTVQDKIPIQRENAPLVWPSWSYIPGPPPEPVKTSGKKVVILTDSDETSTNCVKMTERLMLALSGNAELVNLHDLDIRGGCLGCCQCGIDNTCVYTDGYRDFYTKTLQAADIIIMAGTVHDRYLSSTWKQFFDRSFFKGHTPGLKGKQIGFVIAGPLQQLPHLKEALSSWADNGDCRALFVTDEDGNSEKLDALLDGTVTRLVNGAETGYIPPHTFYAVGGHKIFRDAIYANLRFPFLADYRYYKENGLFDFPRMDLRTRVFGTVLSLFIKIPGFRREVLSGIKSHMIQPFERVLQNA